MLRHDTYTKYLSRHAMSNVTDTLLYGDNTERDKTRTGPVSEDTVTPGFSDPRSLNPIGSSDWGSLDPRIQ